MAEITFEPGSPSERLAAHFKANPDAVLDRRGVAAFLLVASAFVDTAVEPGMMAGLITVATTAELGRVWRAGPRLQHWTPSPVPAAKLLAVKTSNARRARRERLPVLDVLQLKVATGAPPPVAQARKGATLHDKVFDLLTEDGQHVADIPIGYRGSMSKAVQVYMDHRPALKAKSAILVRTIDAKTIGLWRVSRAEFNLRGYSPDNTARKNTKNKSDRQAA